MLLNVKIKILKNSKFQKETYFHDILYKKTFLETF